MKPMIEDLVLQTRMARLLITSASHLYRSVKIFQKQGLRVLPLPVDYQTAHHLSWRSFDLSQGAKTGIACCLS